MNAAPRLIRAVQQGLFPADSAVPQPTVVRDFDPGSVAALSASDLCTIPEERHLVVARTRYLHRL